MRLTASRAFGLVSLARRSSKHTEDAVSSFGAPGARLLFSSRLSPPPWSTLVAAQLRAGELQHLHIDDSLRGPKIQVARWRALFTGPIVGSTASAESAELPGPCPLRPTSPSPLASLDQPPALPASPIRASAAAYSAGAAARQHSDESSAVPNGPAAPRGSAHSDHAAAPELSTSTAAVEPAGSQQAVAGLSYNDPKDGSFSGRIVQHDGSRAVHLLVSGSGSRDYNMRMVRCHARDELLFGNSSGAGSGATCSTAGAAAAATAGGHGGAVVRGEDVPFRTFVYRQICDTVSATFLPAGYPETTGQNYVRFMCWQGVNNVAVTANSVLASTFMLYAVGLGAGSIPTAGALNWVLKDGMGQLGTLLFGKSIAHNFDVHSKTWFFLSAVMLQAAAALELLTVLVPEHFLLMGSLANTLKGLAWMAAGSTRSVFHLSFARDNNIADVTAKGTSQYIFASLVGTAGGALMCAAVGQSGTAAATCFGALAAAAVGSSYLAVQAIPLTTLNATRLQLLVDAFLDSISPSAHRPARHRRGDDNCNIDDEDDDDDDDDEDNDEDDVEGVEGRSGLGSAGRGHGHCRSHSHSRLVHDSGDHGLYDSGRVDLDIDIGNGVGMSQGDGFRRLYDSEERHERERGRRAQAGGSEGIDSKRREREGWSDEEDEWDGIDGEGARRQLRGRSEGLDCKIGGGSGSGSGSGDGNMGGARRWYQRPRVYRTVDRCFIGPSVHEYEMMYDDSLEARVPTPLELSPLDPPLPYFSRGAGRLSPPIIVGSRLEHVVDGNPNLLVMLLTAFKYAHFMVLPRQGRVHVVLHEKADPRDMVQAYMQACILRRRLRNGSTPFPDPDEQTAELRLELQESLAAAERLTTIFMSTVQANGWTVSKIVVEAQRRRARW